MREQSKIVAKYIEQYGMESLLYEVDEYLNNLSVNDVKTDKYILELHIALYCALINYQKRNQNAQ